MILTGMDLGMAIGSPTLGMLAGLASYKSMFGYSSICIFSLLAIYLFMMIRSNNKKIMSPFDKEVS